MSRLYFFSKSKASALKVATQNFVKLKCFGACGDLLKLELRSPRRKLAISCKSMHDTLEFEGTLCIIHAHLLVISSNLRFLLSTEDAIKQRDL